jgi:hypothetical protein
MRCLPFTLLPLLLAACARQPVAPDRVAQPEFAAIRSEITGTIMEVDGPADCTADPRVGEIVLFTGEINYVLTAITTPSGVVDTTGKFMYDPAVHLVGAASGRVWRINTTNTNPSFIFHANGDGSVTKVSEREFYTNAAGGRLMLRVNFLFVVNANGTVTASRDWVYTCIGG